MISLHAVREAQESTSCGAFREGSLLDHAMRIMERYSTNLEQQITDRTRMLTEETRKSDDLIYRFLPRCSSGGTVLDSRQTAFRYVADRLKQGQSVPPRTHESVTVLFSDVGDFDKITALSSPLQIVNMLNDIYMTLDNTLDEYDVFRVSPFWMHFFLHQLILIFHPVTSSVLNT